MSADLTITLDISGWKAFKAQYPAMISRALDGAAEEIVGDVVQSFGTSPPGIEYARPRGGVHVASQPGFAPNVDTGALMGSMHWQRGDDLERYIRDGVEYGEFLELGVGMEARPFIAPAMRRFAKRAPAYFAGAMQP